MKAIVFDSGPIISLTLNNLLWLLEPLKEKFGGEFYITPMVYDELIRKPLATRKYKFEALQILPLISRGVLKVLDVPEARSRSLELLKRINSTFKAQGNWINVVHTGEMEAVASAIYLGDATIVIDERTTRKLIEDPESVASRLSKKLHINIEINRENMNYIKKDLGSLNVIRSTELAVVAYKLGLLKPYLMDDEKKLVPDLEKSLLEGILWGIKLNGCSIKEEEIYKMINIVA